MNIFDFGEYKTFLRARLEAMPKRGRGELQKLSQVLSMHPTRVSHIFNGDVHLTFEQAAGLTKHWGLTQIESEYFMALVQLARAGTKELRQLLEKQVEGLRLRGAQLVNRVPRDKVLSDEDKSVFYSSWLYSGFRLATSVDEISTLDALADRFELSREKVRGIVDFLLKTGLCIEKDGRLQMGPKTTHVESTSPLVLRHHTNWRLKALARHERLTDQELAYTCPVSLNERDQAVIRDLLLQTIDRFLKTVTSSDPSDTLACLNVDWFNF